ncbi:MAG TPA: AraC family transcriptional regulator [Burkholderiales bacterium]|nr:AraC family transcriptional regulator [Burkholderiales bacterium]
MTASCTASAAYVLAVIDVAVKAGAAREPLLQCVGAGALASPQERVPMSRLIALFDTAVVLTGRPDLGLEFGRRVQPGTYSTLGYALMTCDTLADAIALVPHYRRLVFDYGYSDTALTLVGDHVEFAWLVQAGSLPYCVPLAEAMLAGWYSFGRWISNAELALTAVHFAHAAPTDVAPYGDYFGCPVHFGRKRNALRFPRTLLDTPLSQADRSLHLAMREQARTALDHVFGGREIGQRTRQALSKLLPKCEAGLDAVASLLEMTPRTLQRRLREEGLNFKQVLDDLRRELALVYLADASLSSLDIALLLGFAEQSSFTRACKEWTGSTPTQYRRRGDGGALSHRPAAS